LCSPGSGSLDSLRKRRGTTFDSVTVGTGRVSKLRISIILTGLGAVLFAGLKHRQYMQVLRAHGLEVGHTMATVVAALISIPGLLALFAMMFG
jgi:hypothetical protein